MARWKMVHQGFKGLFLIGMICLLTSCESSPGGPECGGTGSRVACLEVVSVEPMDSEGDTTSDVDAFQDICSIDANGMPVFETFTAHNANVTFANTSFPGAQGSFDIRLISFSVDYSLNDCPPLASGCPPLTSFTGFEPVLIRAGQTLTRTFPYVPIAVKAEYEDAGGSTLPVSYNVTYTFVGQTTPFNDEITIEVSSEFVIGNFDLCN